MRDTYFWPRIQSSPRCIHLFHTDLLSSFSGTGDQLPGTWEILLLGATGRQTGPPAPLIPQVSWGSDRTCFPLALTSSLGGSVILSSDSVLGTVRAAVRIPASLSAVDRPAGSLRARTAPAQTWARRADPASLWHWGPAGSRLGAMGHQGSSAPSAVTGVQCPSCSCTDPATGRLPSELHGRSQRSRASPLG